ncbi:hypothetical protein BJV82DRAFT_669121 [Fennellomyces sp. T-0311]|nr:hypothetical protein BJV82DRAFT_669121 [Fennellomyces sp. T-0311]
MYIKYHRNQTRIWDIEGWVEDIADTGKLLLEDLEVPDFKPTWLVRVSDMNIVPGTSVDGHYWSLSYSWNQSGEIFCREDGRYERIDTGQHLLTRSKRAPDRFIKNFWNRKGEIVNDLDPEITSTQSVTFEYLIQQICMDFGIDYIWFDQICINQNNIAEKMQDIKQMHRIYNKARCTLVLVPELQAADGIANIEMLHHCQWSQRSWTLEEAYVSKGILFVGQNTHLWLDSLTTFNNEDYGRFLKNIQDARAKRWNVCSALWYSKERVSIKAHDQVFALANIFPSVKKNINFDYSQPIHELMIQFYGHLAQDDITILLFGAPIDSDREDRLTAIRQEASLLPSWIGANGIHMTQDLLLSKPSNEAFRHTIEGRDMRLTSDAVGVRIEAATSITRCTTTDNSSLFTHDDLPRSIFRGKSCKIGCESIDLTFASTTAESQNIYNQELKQYGLKATHFLPLKRKNRSCHNTLSEPTHLGGFLSLIEECSGCIILYGLDFLFGPYYCCPVIKEDSNGHRSIGVCFLCQSLDLQAIVQPEQAFFIR